MVGRHEMPRVNHAEPIFGDIGDYLKLGILRALSPEYHLGVAW